VIAAAVVAGLVVLAGVTWFLRCRHRARR
jgi:hypothetical protein